LDIVAPRVPLEITLGTTWICVLVDAGPARREIRAGRSDRRWGALGGLVRANQKGQF